MDSYSKTPSFYNTDEAFKKYLAYTSYYVALQNGVSKIVGLVKPKEILELGSGTGATAQRLAADNPFCNIVGVDMRSEMVELGRQNALEMRLENVQYCLGEMVSYVRALDRLPELTILLYSFHHIEDPIQNKIDFLNNCKAKMPDGGLLCIAETFLPEFSDTISHDVVIRKLWANRMYEAYSTTFWASLEGLEKEDIKRAKNIGCYSKNNECEAGNLVLKRENEYLVRLSDLQQFAKDVGLEVVLAEPCNSLNEYIVLLSKE
ncbi:MAG: class I SAM-dependent methyltransferase [Peptococcaceae bacterium]|nr:class I SAM-dependent methyltransferase [Peptococcaceae bacterium]